MQIRVQKFQINLTIHAEVKIMDCIDYHLLPI